MKWKSKKRVYLLGSSTAIQAKKTPKRKLAKLDIYLGIRLKEGIQEMCTGILHAHILCYKL